MIPCNYGGDAEENREKRKKKKNRFWVACWSQVLDPYAYYKNGIPGATLLHL